MVRASGAERKLNELIMNRLELMDRLTRDPDPGDPRDDLAPAIARIQRRLRQLAGDRVLDKAVADLYAAVDDSSGLLPTPLVVELDRLAAALQHQLPETLRHLQEQCAHVRRELDQEGLDDGES